MKHFIKPLFSLALLLVAGLALAQPALYVDGTHYKTLESRYAPLIRVKSKSRKCSGTAARTATNLNRC